MAVDNDRHLILIQSTEGDQRPSNLPSNLSTPKPLTDFVTAVPPEKLPALVLSGPLPQPLLPFTGSQLERHSGGGGGSQSSVHSELA